MNAQAKNLLSRIQKRRYVIFVESSANYELPDSSIGNDDLLTVVPVEFVRSFSKRRIVENQQTALPCEHILQFPVDLLRHGYGIGRRYDDIARRKVGRLSRSSLKLRFKSRSALHQCNADVVIVAAYQEFGTKIRDSAIAHEDNKWVSIVVLDLEECFALLQFYESTAT